MLDDSTLYERVDEGHMQNVSSRPIKEAYLLMQIIFNTDQTGQLNLC